MANGKNSDLKKIFEEYNTAEPISASFDDAKISGILSGTSKERMPAKIDALCSVVLSVESSINDMLKSRNNTNIAEVNISRNFTITSNSNDPNCLPHIKLAPVDEKTSVANITLNINVQKLINLPAEELYSRIYSIVYASVFDKSLEKGSSGATQEVENAELVRGMDEVEEKEAGQNPTLLGRIVKYIKEQLKEILGLDYPEEKLDTISREITNNYSSAYGGADIVYEEMFDASAIKGDPTVKQLGAARVSKIISKADMAAAYENPRAEMSYRQQASALLSEQTKESFNKMKNGGSAEMQAFCQTYITQMLASNGIDIGDLEITFDSVRMVNGREVELPQGTFYDGNPKSINVNMDKVKDLTDLVMTLTHETTHAMDSISNSQKGVFNARGGGLLGVARGVDFKKLGVDKKSEEGILLSLLNSMAYHLDPNERRGRIGELAGLQFMSEMAGVDTDARRQVDKNIAGFEKYQKLTMQYAQDLMDPNSKRNLEALKARYEAMKDQLSDNVKAVFDEKFQYIEQALAVGLDMSAEQESLRNARNISREMNAQAPISEEEWQRQ
jgi:hypothetical protein